MLVTQLMGQGDLDRLFVRLLDGALPPAEKIAQAFDKVGVAEPQSAPHGRSPFYPGARAGPLSPWGSFSPLSMPNAPVDSPRATRDA